MLLKSNGNGDSVLVGRTMFRLRCTHTHTVTHTHTHTHTHKDTNDHTQNIDAIKHTYLPEKIYIHTHTHTLTHTHTHTHKSYLVCEGRHER
jgi:hypothetical protein